MMAQNSNRPAEPQAIHHAWDDALAGMRLPTTGWMRIAARSLIRLLSQPVSEKQSFRWSIAHWCRHRDTLRDMDDRPRILDTANLADEYPLIVTLVIYSKEANPVPLATLLMRLVLELYLRGLHPATMLQVAETLRGLLQSTGLHSLKEKIGHAGTLAELRAALNQIEEDVGPKNPLTGHVTFDRLWRKELRAICDQLETAIVEVGEEPIDDDPQPLDQARWLEAGSMSSTNGLDLEDAPIIGTHPKNPNETIPPNRLGVAEAKALAFERYCNGNLHRDPNNILPTPIAAECWRAACDAADSAVATGDVELLEEQLALLVSIEAGIAERDVPGIVLGNNTEGDVLAIDTDGQALRRPEVRPSKAFQPEGGEESIWLPTGGDAIFPLTDSVVALVLKLIGLRKNDPTLRRCSLLVSHPALKDRQVIRRAVKHAAPHLPVLASLLQLRIAAMITQTLGSDAAQLAFGETFGDSAAGTFYLRPSAASIASTVWNGLREITGNSNNLPAKFVMPDHFLGSRAAPATSPIAESWHAMKTLTQKNRGRKTLNDLISQWENKRNKLAIHLMLATGHRPNNSISKILIGDLIPEHALVIISDKISDPAHLTRVASTGWRFMQELGDYLAFVRSLARDPSLGGIKRVAKGVLDGSIPLFTAASEDGAALGLDISELMSSLPSTWREKPNVHRHMLCNALAAAGIDPELRYFQMGWIVGSANASGDCSPYSLIAASTEIANQIDACIEEMGWACDVTKSSLFDWSELPPLREWNDTLAKHQGDFNDQCRHLRALLAEHRQEAKPIVHDELQRAFVEILPEYKLKSLKGHKVLRPANSVTSTSEPMLIGEGRVRTILERFSRPQFSVLHEMVAVSELARLLREGVRKGIFKSYIPSVPVLSLSREPSPVIRGSGLAVRQADAVRHRIFELANTINKLKLQDQALPLAMLTWLSILCFTPYRFLEQARQILSASIEHCYSDASPLLIRLPLLKGHAALSGAPALLVRRLAALTGVKEILERLDELALGSYAIENLAPLIPPSAKPTSVAKLLEQTLQMAGRIELSGIERTVMLNNIKPALVSAERAASIEDQVTIPSTQTADSLLEDSDDPYPASDRGHRKNPPHRAPEKDVVVKILRFFSYDFDGEIDGMPAQPISARRKQLIPVVTKRLESLGREITVTLLLLEYILHLLVDGGPRSSGTLKVSSIYTMLNRFARPLIYVTDNRDMEQASQREMTTLMLTVILQAPTKMRVEVLDEIRQFINYSSVRYDLEAPEWAVLYSAAGERWKGNDPAVVGDMEADRVACELMENIHKLTADLSLSPYERRIRELQLIGHLLLEASGARPRSVHGLTLADIYLDGTGDYIHLKARGRYASVKTVTSSGFISLAGKTWDKYRGWFMEWIEARRSGIEADALSEIPLFQIPMATLGKRFPMATVFGRIGQLIRWSTGQSAGRTYWLRKRRIQLRHLSVYRHPTRRARDVFRALREAGQVLIWTPLTSYLGDPMAYMGHNLDESKVLTRSQIADLTGIKHGTLDQRWQRLASTQDSNIGLTSAIRLQESLSLPPEPWTSREPAQLGPPPPYCNYRERPSWVAISHAMSLLTDGLRNEAIADWTGLAPEMIPKVHGCMKEFTLRSGIKFGNTNTALHKPRELDSTRSLWALLETSDDRLQKISSEWLSLASRVSISAGCPLIDEFAVSELREIVVPRGYRLSAVAEQTVPTYMPYAADGKDAYGSWPTLRWILAVAWVVGRLPGSGNE